MNSPFNKVGKVCEVNMKAFGYQVINFSINPIAEQFGELWGDMTYEIVAFELKVLFVVYCAFFCIFDQLLCVVIAVLVFRTSVQ